MRLPWTDLDVSPISFGTADLGGSGDDAFRLLDRYAEAGGNFLDSAHCYAFWSGAEGRPERTIGEWLRKTGLRDRVVLSTKGGHPPQNGYPHPEAFLSPEAIRGDFAESQERLGTQTIDLYYLHRDDGQTPVDEVIDLLNDLPGARYLGASNWSIARVLEANAYATKHGRRGFVALQNQWSLAIPTWTITEEPTMRFVTEADRAACQKHELTIHSYSSTANGFFATGRPGGFVGPENEERRRRTEEVAKQLGKTPNQVALAWLMSQPGTVVPIVGTTNLEHLSDALGAMNLRLDPATRDHLSGA